MPAPLCDSSEDCSDQRAARLLSLMHCLSGSNLQTLAITAFTFQLNYLQQEGWSCG